MNLAGGNTEGSQGERNPGSQKGADGAGGLQMSWLICEKWGHRKHELNWAVYWGKSCENLLILKLCMRKVYALARTQLRTWWRLDWRSGYSWWSSAQVSRHLSPLLQSNFLQDTKNMCMNERKAQSVLQRHSERSCKQDGNRERNEGCDNLNVLWRPEKPVSSGSGSHNV